MSNALPSGASRNKPSPENPPSKVGSLKLPPQSEAIIVEYPTESIEPGDEPPEEDEFLATGWDATSSKASTSVTSSIYAHTYENGRRYHSYKYGRYPIPNDDLEQSREDMKHAMMLEMTVRAL